MYRILLLLTVFIFIALSITSCNHETPQQTEQIESYQQTALAKDTEVLYLMGNEEPISAETACDFVKFGPKPFFLWALDLTDEQKIQLREIAQKYHSQMRDLRMEFGTNTDWQVIKEKWQELREQMIQETMTILTDEQKALLEEIKAQIDAGEYPTIIIEKRVALLTEKLNLSQDQQEKLTQLMVEYGAKIVELRNNEYDPSTTREEMHQLLEGFNNAFKALLDEDQLAVYEDMTIQFHRHHHHGHEFGHRF